MISHVYEGKIFALNFKYKSIEQTKMEQVKY